MKNQFVYLFAFLCVFFVFVGCVFWFEEHKFLGIIFLFLGYAAVLNACKFIERN